jgi:hypothetical protein
MKKARYRIDPMRRFAGFSLGSGSILDETIVPNLSHPFDAHRIIEKIFGLINQYLFRKKLRLSRGATVDATMIEAPGSTRNTTDARYPEMHQTKKSNNLAIYIWSDDRKLHCHDYKMKLKRPTLELDSFTANQKHKKSPSLIGFIMSRLIQSSTNQKLTL